MSNGPLKKDGTSDMRYKVNREAGLAPNTNVDGSRDKRKKEEDKSSYSGYSRDNSFVTCNQTISNISAISNGPCKKDGTLDMRYKVNKEAVQA
jgi:hypothetical protein